MSWRRILLLSLVFVVALGTATWAVLHRSGAATKVVARELQKLLATPSSITGTAIDVAAGRLSVTGLRVDDPARPGQALLNVASVHIDVAANPFGNLLGLHALVVDGIDLEFGPELPRPAALLRSPGTSSGGGDAAPQVDLRNGRIRFTPRAGVAPLELHDLNATLTPVEDTPHCAELNGTVQFADLAATLHLRGTLDLRAQAYRFFVSTRDVALGRAALDRLRTILDVDLGTFDAAARVRELTFVVTIPGTGSADRAPVFEVVAELDGVRVTAEQLPSLIKQATVTLHATTRDGGALTAQLQQESAAGRFDVTARGQGPLDAPTLDVRASGKDIRIDEDVLAVLQTFAVGREVTDALRPTKGRADVELFLRNPQRRGGTTELELSLQDVSMAYHGFGDPATRASFPLPVEKARGRVRLRDDIVLLEDVDAVIAPFAGGGTVRMTGRIETTKPATEDSTLDIHASGVEFTPHLRAALTALLRDDGNLYDRFAPSGRTDVTVLVRPRSALQGVWSVEVRPTAAVMRWAGFPYRLEDLKGTVIVRADGAGFDLAGTHGSGKLAMRGRIPLDASQVAEGLGFEAVVEVDNLAIDDELRAAVAVLAPEIDAPWQKSGAKGRLGGRVKVWRPQPEDPLFHDVRLDLHGVDLLLPTAPWTAKDLQGQMFAQGSGSDTRLDFDALRGRLEHGTGEPAWLAMLGSIATGSTFRSDLAFVVRELELDEQLGRTLEQLGALGRNTWNSLRPSGKVDLVCRHERQGTDADRLRLVVQLVDVSSQSPILLRPAHKMTGELSIGDGELRFEDVRGEMGGALVYASDGRVRTLPAPDGRSEIAFRVKANGLPVDDGLANLFSGPLRQAVLDRDLDGRADVDALSLRFAIPDTGNPLPFETTIGGQLRLYDVDMSLGTGEEGIRVEGISGVVALAESVVTDTGGGLRGTLLGTTFRVFDQPFEAVEGTFDADAQRIQIGSLASRFHGGSVRSAEVDRPALHYLLPAPAVPEGRLSADLAFEKVDVYSFLGTCGWVNPPYSGTASGNFALERLDGSNVVAATGDGRLLIERANLGVVPLFTSIYAQLPAPDRPRFDRLDSRFRLANRTVSFDTLNVRSNLLAVNGSGTMDLDGYLDIRMTLDNILGTSADPVVMPLIDRLTKGILRFHMFGYLRDLRVEQRWITERSPMRREVLPMPPPVERQPLPDY